MTTRHAILKTIEWENQSAREIKIVIDARDSKYIEESKGGNAPPMLVNGGPLAEGIELLLKLGYTAVETLKGEGPSIKLADRVKQLLSALDYDHLTDFQAKCVLLVEKELKPR